MALSPAQAKAALNDTIDALEAQGVDVSALRPAALELDLAWRREQRDRQDAVETALGLVPDQPELYSWPEVLLEVESASRIAAGVRVAHSEIAAVKQAGSPYHQRPAD